MAAVDLTQCNQVAKRELAYLHDIQINIQELNKFFMGQEYFNNVVAPKLTKAVNTNTDYLEQV
jgi:hypothetical protein